MIKKSLITGGAGFIGSHLARRLLEAGHEVTVMDNLFTGTKANIYDLMDNPRFTFILHDVTQPFWGQFDEVYNLACPASPIHYQRNPVETIKTCFWHDERAGARAQNQGASSHSTFGDLRRSASPSAARELLGQCQHRGLRSCYMKASARLKPVRRLCASTMLMCA